MFLFKTSITYLKLYGVFLNFFLEAFASIYRLEYTNSLNSDFFSRMQDLDCFYFHLSVLIRFSKI